MQGERTKGDTGAAVVGVRAAESAQAGLLGRTFSALRHPNYRLYFTGQLISLVGTWMQNVAQGWLVYQLTDSPLMLGLVAFAASIPVLFLGLGAGVVVDRMPRRMLLMTTQAAMMLLALILAALVWLQVVQAWHIVVLSFVLGVCQAFDSTARQTFVKEMVGKEDLMNAIALNSALYNMSRIVGPALAGITLAAVGPFWCFLLNGFSFLAVIGGLWRMVFPPFKAPPRGGSVVSDVMEGLRYIRHNQTVLNLILLVTVAALFGFAYATLLPAFAQDVLHTDAQGLGWLNAASGIGSLAGALLMAGQSKFLTRGRMVTIGSIVFPALLVALALTQVLWLACLLLIGVGFFFMIENTSSNTLVQTVIPDHLRGRVMSVYMMTFFGLSPIGSLQAGIIAEHLGTPAGMGVGAVIALVYGVFILWRVPLVRKLA